ncbi:MAG: GDYXXLXY domain-containing protein [Betaproteobacteria bacterium]
MRKWLIAGSTLVVLALVNVGIWQREGLLDHGKVVLLELAPVDPRSLMQGDFMRLSYRVLEDAFPRQVGTPPATDGRVIVAIDDRGVGRFARLDDGTPLRTGDVALRYRVRAADVKFATNAYFFEEGHAGDFSPARYGEFRVAADGEMILTGLRDKALRLLVQKPLR